MSAVRLDDAVHEARRALEESAVNAPDVLLWVGTGVGTLPAALRRARSVSLHEVPGVPPPWRDVELRSGDLGGARVWLIEDAPDQLEFGGGDHAAPAWERAFPAWLAAQSGARLCLHTSAGMRLPTDDAPPVGALAAIRDHINLSGRTPLIGIGETRLGPLFPDQSRLHHAGLRHIALERAGSLGIGLTESIVACTLGPTLTTPAERHWLGTSGAGIAVQGLAEPLVACAHAGLAVLGLVAVTDSGEGALRMPELLERSEAIAPAMEDLITALAEDLALVARELEEEEE